MFEVPLVKGGSIKIIPGGSLEINGMLTTNILSKGSVNKIVISTDGAVQMYRYGDKYSDVLFSISPGYINKLKELLQVYMTPTSTAVSTYDITDRVINLEQKYKNQRDVLNEIVQKMVNYDEVIEDIQLHAFKDEVPEEVVPMKEVPVASVPQTACTDVYLLICLAILASTLCYIKFMFDNLNPTPEFLSAVLLRQQQLQLPSYANTSTLMQEFYLEPFESAFLIP